MKLLIKAVCVCSSIVLHCVNLETGAENSELYYKSVSRKLTNSLFSRN